MSETLKIPDELWGLIDKDAGQVHAICGEIAALKNRSRAEGLLSEYRKQERFEVALIGVHPDWKERAEKAEWKADGLEFQLSAMRTRARAAEFELAAHRAEAERPIGAGDEIGAGDTVRWIGGGVACPTADPGGLVIDDVFMHKGEPWVQVFGFRGLGSPRSFRAENVVLIRTRATVRMLAVSPVPAASSGNYVANREVYPTQVWFSNGRTVSIRFDENGAAFLDIEMSAYGMPDGLPVPEIEGSVS